MVIAKQFIQTPYKKYSVRLGSVTARKLTIMEWTILRITNDYSINPKYKTFKLSQFFEDILGMDRSELLIRPCINSLLRLKLIEIDGYTSLALASDTVVGKIHLTKDGLNALQHNYIPGGTKETEESIFYDLLLGQPKEYMLDQSAYDSDHSAVRITNKTSFDVQFPADEIIASINMGRLFPSKYKNNNTIAQEAACTNDEVVWSTGLLMLDQNDDGTYSCNYPITNDIYAQLVKMTGAPIKSLSAWTLWPEQQELPGEVLSAKFALHDIEDYIGYSDYIYVNCSIWSDFLKKYKKNIKGSTCIVFGAKEFKIESGDFTAVFVPFAPDDNRIIVMVPGHEAICAAQKSCSIENRTINMWFSYRQHLDHTSEEWLATEVSKLVEPSSIALLFLPIMETDIQLQMQPVREMLKRKTTFGEKLLALQRLNRSCGDLRIELPNYDMLIEDLADAVDYRTTDTIVDDLIKAYNHVFVDCDKLFYAKQILAVAERYGFRSGVLDLHKILACILQGANADVDGFMELAEERLFANMPAECLNELFEEFASNIPEPIPQISYIAKDYNSLRKGLMLVSGLLKDMDWYGEANRDALLNAIINCSVLPVVQQTVDSIKDTIDGLINRGCSVFDVDGTCYGFVKRLDALKQMLSCFIYPTGEAATVYLVDTCVFLHSPDILSYFREDEMVRIPFTVLRELDYHKDNNPDPSLKKCAAFACKQIEKKTESAKQLFDDHFAVEPRDYPEMLPEGFSKHKHDDLILSAAIRYKLLKPRILTDDTNFRNIARTQGIDPIAWDKFVTERGGVAVRGQANITPQSSEIEINATETLVDTTPETATSATVEETIAESPAVVTPEKLFGMPIIYAVKKFGLNSKELSLLLSHKMKTCGDLAKTDEIQIKSFYKKKKAFMANHLLEVRRKIQAEANRLSAASTEVEE